MDIFDRKGIIELVGLRAGIPWAEAERSLDAVLATLDESEGADTTTAAFYQRVAERTNLPIGVALERTQVVCHVLAATADTATRAQLDVSLPRALHALFELPATTRPPPRRHRNPRSIAEGHPGSEHPLSEASPPSGQHDSVALTGDPHAETKLSSGTPGERKPIATAVPPTKPRD